MSNKPNLFWHSSLLLLLAAAAGQASAFEATIKRSSQAYVYGHAMVIDKASTFDLQVSPSAIAAINATHAEVTPIDGTAASVTRNQRGTYTSITLSAPVDAITIDIADQDHSSLTAKSFATPAGMLLRSVADGLANTGGSWAISNLQVDLEGRRILADLDGANGVGFKEQVTIWHFETMTPLPPVGQTVCSEEFVGCQTTLAVPTTLSGLTFTESSFPDLTKALGLTPDGVSAFSKVQSFGTITSSVPEPATVMQLGLGLVGLGLVAKRRRLAKPSLASLNRQSPLTPSA